MVLASVTILTIEYKVFKGSGEVKQSKQPLIHRPLSDLHAQNNYRINAEDHVTTPMDLGESVRVYALKYGVVVKPEAKKQELSNEKQNMRKGACAK